MGVEIYLQKADGSLFELGKTRTGFDFAFKGLSSDTKIPFSLPNEEGLTKLLGFCAENFGNWDKKGDLKECISNIARKIIKWTNGEKVTMIYDCEDSFDYKKINGSRYDRAGIP